ncbi:hypothetical protein [Amycolatopsis ultiminotia]|uniref:hypothetical protein n=1 Tax=Amycolatopsis ultiminotia TaxID=543629 RepID=UPI0031F1380F
MEVPNAHNGSAKFDLDIVIIPDADRRFGEGTEAGRITVLLEYNTDLFDPGTTRTLPAQYCALL